MTMRPRYASCWEGGGLLGAWAWAILGPGRGSGGRGGREGACRGASLSVDDDEAEVRFLLG